jgi:hypothetical protein
MFMLGGVCHPALLVWLLVKSSQDRNLGCKKRDANGPHSESLRDCSFICQDLSLGWKMGEANGLSIVGV